MRCAILIATQARKESERLSKLRVCVQLQECWSILEGQFRGTRYSVFDRQAYSSSTKAPPTICVFSELFGVCAYRISLKSAAQSRSQFSRRFRTSFIQHDTQDTCHLRGQAGPVERVKCNLASFCRTLSCLRLCVCLSIVRAPIAAPDPRTSHTSGTLIR